MIHLRLSKLLFINPLCLIIFMLVSFGNSFAQKTEVNSIPYVDPSYKKDEDHDGVPDGRDECPHTPKGEKVTPFGCPLDTDFDGTYDYQDKCPTIPGPKENFGCPWGDRDKDGIKDNVDECPDQPGPAIFHGCPDTDKDGVPDNEDACPTVPGRIENRGCPDADTDSDGDGVMDSVDKCPMTPGPKENFGCPILKEKDKAKVDKAFKNLLFETGKAIIKTSSYASLDQLAQVLIDNPTTILSLEGHTDDVGDDESNLTLSQNRAEAVKQYLTNQSIDSNRISAQGYGETRPIADNTTAAGKQKNRRVEMKIKYR